MSIYTKDDWERDRNFSAAPGQEITEEIYWDMCEALPPHSMPRRIETAGYQSGFCMGEPSNTDSEGRLTYLTFGQMLGKYYYIGDFPLVSTTPYKEIFRLKKMLYEAKIPYRFCDTSIRVRDGDKSLLVCVKYQILYSGMRNAESPDGSVYMSAVEGNISHGGENDRIEIMQQGEDDVVENLTAEEVFDRIKAHYDGTRLKQSATDTNVGSKRE